MLCTVSHVSLYTHIYMCMYMYTYICMYVCKHIHIYVWGPLTYFWGKEKDRVSAVSSYRGFWDHMGYGHDYVKMVTLTDKGRTSWAWQLWYTSGWSGSYGWKRGQGFWGLWSLDFWGAGLPEKVRGMGPAPSCIKVLL